MHPYQVIRRPVVTEKSNTHAQEQGQYTFRVDERANKAQIKEAVEKAFEVTVERVNVINVPGKTRRLGRRVRRIPGWKKAVVTLAEGQRIELFEGV